MAINNSEVIFTGTFISCTGGYFWHVFTSVYIKLYNMKKQDNDTEKDIKTDLKHDTMEFSAATDGDDALDTDDETFEEDGISIDELDALEDDDLDDQAAALDSVETDRKEDDDNLPEEDWTDDIDDDDKEADNELKEEHRK